MGLSGGGGGGGGSGGGVVVLVITCLLQFFSTAWATPDHYISMSTTTSSIITNDIDTGGKRGSGEEEWEDITSGAGEEEVNSDQVSSTLTSPHDGCTLLLGCLV